MPRNPESSIAEKYSNRTAQHTYMVSFDAQSSNTTINFSHSVEADNASQAVGSEKSARIICSDRKFVYFCIADQCNTKHDKYLYPHKNAVSLGNIKSLVLHGLQTERASRLFVYILN